MSEMRSPVETVASTSGPQRFLTPADLCERWRIDLRTLDKFELPWVWLTPRIRRVAEDAVVAFEREKSVKLS